MDAAFERAVDIVARLSKSGPVQTSYDEKLLLYALFKQATEGPPRGSRPGVLDLLGRAKWDAWKKREALSAHDAKRGYVEALKKILRGYGDKAEANDYVRELDQMLSQGDPRDLVISGSLADSDVSSEEERRRYQPPPPTRTRQATQESSQASSSRGPGSASRSHSNRSLTQKRAPRQPPVREDDDTASSGSEGPISPPAASSRERLPPQQRQAPSTQARYAPSNSGSNYASSRAPPSSYAPPSSAPYLPSQSYVRPPSAGSHHLRSPLAPPISTPGPDIEGLRQKLSALEAFLTQPDVPEDRKRQVEIEIAKTRGYLAVISQRFSAMTPTSGITLSELQARQQQTIQRMQPSTPGGTLLPPSNLERALDNIGTSLTALNERLSRLEARPPTPTPPARLPLMELINRLLFILRIRDAPRGQPRWNWLAFMTTLRGAVTDFAFLALFVNFFLSVRQHGIGWQAMRETWMRTLLMGAARTEMARQLEAAS